MRNKSKIKEKEKFVNLFCELSDFEKAAICRGLGISILEITPEKILNGFSQITRKNKRKLIKLMEEHLNDDSENNNTKGE